MRPLLPTYLHLIASALFPIWVAAHASLVRPSSAAAPATKAKAGSKDDENEEPEEVSQKIESLKPSDAALFPILAGATLASLYFILKYLDDPAWLNWGMNIYFSQMGMFFAYGFLTDAFANVRGALFPRCYSWAGARWTVDPAGRRYVRMAPDSGEVQAEHTSPLPAILRLAPLPSILKRFIWRLREVISAKATLMLHIRGLLTLRATPTLLDAIALVLAIVLTYVHAFVTKPWPLTNFLGLSFCYGALQMTSPSTAWTATLLLSALFFYDIYFVFFTPIMVHVATNLDVPIKMVFPRPDGCVLPVGAEDGSAEMEEYLKCLGKKRAMAMLGLGDIVVPGMVMAFALRWDLWLHYFKLQKKPATSKASDGESDKIDKEPYRAATGSWGERFWTASTLRPAALNAKRFNKPYFMATVVGYVLGLCVTVCVMQVAKHAQPALLYLVPGVLGALWGTALVKGEIKLLWNYIEDDEDESGKKDKKIKKDKSKKCTKSLKKVRERSKTEVDTKEGADASTDAGQEDRQIDNTIVDSEGATDKKANESTCGDKPTSPKSDLTKELESVSQHAIYFSLKLPDSSTTTKKSPQSKEGSVTVSPQPTSPTTRSTKSTSKTDASPKIKSESEAEEMPDTTDDDEHASESESDSEPDLEPTGRLTKWNTRNKPNKQQPVTSRRQTRASSTRALRSSGYTGTETVDDVDEEKARMAKRRRQG